jgi:hypothetical protein
MDLCDYEIAVLRHIQNPRDDDGIIPGAALWAAAEALSEGGYVRAGKLTDKGRHALAGVMLRDFGLDAPAARGGRVSTSALPGAATHFIEADIPIPAPQTVEGRVSDE